MSAIEIPHCPLLLAATPVSPPSHDTDLRTLHRSLYQASLSTCRLLGDCQAWHFVLCAAISLSLSSSTDHLDLERRMLIGNHAVSAACICFIRYRSYSWSYPE